jgi:uncharacterized protein with PhoU and TrkA domain
MSKNSNNRAKRYSREKVFMVNESYAGVKNLSDIFVDLLYSAYCRQKSEIAGDGLNLNGYSSKTGQDNYAGV